jgi:hypothetical protein
MRLLRIGLGILLALSSIGFLIQGGLSRYAKLGIPPTADWKVMSVGLTLLAIGLFLIRPLPWTRRHPTT